MALINCPDCNKEISDKASGCIHCGCPLEKSTNPKTLKKIVLSSYGEEKIEVWKIVNEISRLSFDETDDLVNAVKKSPQTIVDGINIDRATQIVDALLSLTAKAEIVDSDATIEKSVCFSYQKPIIIKCPTCNSKDIMKITAFDRVTSVAFLGLASGNMGKQFYCKSCQFKW